MRIRSLTLRILGVCALGWVLAGCDSGGDTTVINPVQNIAGIVPQAGGALLAAIVANQSPTPAQVTVGGVATPVSVPLGVQANIPAGTPMAVIQPTSQPLSGNFGPTGGSVSIGPNRAALTTNTGITVNTAGVLNQRVAVPVDPVAGTAYAIGFPQGNVETRELTVGGVIFEGRIYFTGGNFISPIPIELKGFLPNNGENAVSSFMSVRWGPGNNGRSARLRVTYGNGFVLDQTQTIAASKALFANFSTDSSNVPATGVQLVEFLIGDL